VRQTTAVLPSLNQVVNELDEEQFQLLYGRWDPLDPPAVATLLTDSPSVRWFVAGGRAARVGADSRHHEDTDVVVPLADLGHLREALGHWHLWELADGALRPLLPGLELTAGSEQLWARRDARHPWQLDLLLDRHSSETEWVFKRDHSVRLPWDRAVHTVGGIRHFRPEIALLHKARLDRPKDRADLAAAPLDPAARIWLADTLARLGHEEWARRARDDAAAGSRSGDGQA
jgi:hypothetical protein